MIDTAKSVSDVGENISAAEEIVSAASIPVSTAATTVSAASEIPTKRRREATTTTTTTTITAAPKPLQDKGKCIMIEECNTPKIRSQRNAKRAEEKRNRPPTRAQQRSIMCTYLKNMKGWNPKSLKSKSFANIQELFDKAMKRVNTFVDYITELVEESSKKAEAEIAQRQRKELTLGNATEDLILERSKDNQHFKSFWMLLLLLHATLHFSSLQMFHKSTCINSGILFTSMTLSTDSRWIKGRDSNSTWKSLEMSSRSALEYRVKTLMHFLLMKKLCQYLRDLVHTGKTYSLTDDDSTPPKKARKFKKPASPKLTTVSVSTEEPTGKSKRVKRPEKKTTKAPARGVVIRETPEIPVSKKKEKVDVTRGKGIELLSQVSLTEDAQFEEV
ncbi:hypothetical protein Tco_1547211 [Tanacetum coccineum]